MIGSCCDEMYISPSGDVDILVDPALVNNQSKDSHQPSTIAALRRDLSSCEIALVDAGIRSATALAALNNTRLLVIPSQEI